MYFTNVYISLALALVVSAIPMDKRAAFTLANGKQAAAQNEAFKTLTPDSSCKDGENACVEGKFAQCSDGKFLLTPCGVGLQCVVLPLVTKPGTSVTCDTVADAKIRVANTGAGSANLRLRTIERRAAAAQRGAAHSERTPI